LFYLVLGVIEVAFDVGLPAVGHALAWKLHDGFAAIDARVVLLLSPLPAQKDSLAAFSDLRRFGYLQQIVAAVSDGVDTIALVL
jgi:hypothetical protein